MATKIFSYAVMSVDHLIVIRNASFLASCIAKMINLFVKML